VSPELSLSSQPPQITLLDCEVCYVFPELKDLAHFWDWIAERELFAQLSDEIPTCLQNRLVS